MRHETLQHFSDLILQNSKSVFSKLTNEAETEKTHEVCRTVKQTDNIRYNLPDLRTYFAYLSKLHIF